MKQESNLFKHKISFCTVCMNRLEPLRKTLPKNIKDNLSYGNLEFVVLNYNSKDDLDNWIEKEMSDYLTSGVLKYIKTSSPKYFLRSHSKNVVSKEATGEIICNVDADNYIGKGFAQYVNNCFLKRKNIFLATDRASVRKDCLGRICLKKKDFETITGYDESMENYGFEDLDLKNRLILLGRQVINISDGKFLNAISHSDDTRLQNEPNAHLIKDIYIKYINHYSTELLYLLTNRMYYTGIVVIHRLSQSNDIRAIFKEFEDDNLHDLNNPIWNLEKLEWKIGNWQKSGCGLILTNSLGVKRIGKIGTPSLNKIVKDEYYKCQDEQSFQKLIMFFSQINNCIKMYENQKNKIIAVNKTFGETELDW